MVRTMLLPVLAFVIAILSAVAPAQTTKPVREEERFTVTPDVAFLPAGREEKLDLYLPKDDGAKRRPAVVVIHGGGWLVGDKADPRETQIAETLAYAGFVCVSINYQMATKDKPAFPTCMDDARAAVRFLTDNAEKYRIDVNRIGAIGGSAGGCMALLLGLKSDAVPAVKAVVALYPPTDLTTHPRNTMVFGHPFTTHPELYRAASPIHQVTRDFPPTLLIHGTADATVPHEQSKLLAARFVELGVRHELVLVEDAPHTFHIKSATRDLRARVIAFFRENLPNP